MKALRWWARGVAGGVLVVVCMGCGGGGGGGRGAPMLAPGATAGSSGQMVAGSPTQMAGGSTATGRGSVGSGGGSAAPSNGSGPSGAPGPGTSAVGRVTFQLPSTEALDFVRVYVGKETRDYDTTFDLFEVQTMDEVASAMEPRLGQILVEPGIYFVALTVVDTTGRESDFSNELRIDTRSGGMASVGGARRIELASVRRLSVWSAPHAGTRAGRGA